MAVGAKMKSSGEIQVEKDLTQPEMRKLVEQTPEKVLGFTETDPPNSSFRDGPCSFYGGTNAMGEEAIAGMG